MKKAGKPNHKSDLARKKRSAAAKKGAETRAKAKAALKQSWAKAGVSDGTKVKWTMKKESSGKPVEKPPEVLGYGTVAVAGYGWENYPQSIRFCCENVKRENLGKVKAAAGNKFSPGYCRCRNNPENYVIVQLVKESGQ